MWALFRLFLLRMDAQCKITPQQALPPLIELFLRNYTLKRVK
jgi:hypothetical protein